MDTNLLSSVVHELVICATKYFPVTGEGGMWDDEVARRVAIGVSYFSVVDAHWVSRRGLSLYVLKIHLEMAGHYNMGRSHTSITNS